MILMTGCAGFIGFHLSKFYLDKKIKVLGIDKKLFRTVCFFDHLVLTVLLITYEAYLRI